MFQEFCVGSRAVIALGGGRFGEFQLLEEV